MPTDHRSSTRRPTRLALEDLEGRLLLTASHAAKRLENSAPAVVRTSTVARPTADRWSWLENTYWYVPTRNLTAVVYDPDTGGLITTTDQTVYQITGYHKGYFSGVTVAQLGGGEPSSAALVGSVTPQGKVLLTFTSSTSVITGYGTMTRTRAGWTMENQMFSTSSSGQIGHWAYMVQTRPGMASWRSLPAVGVSVPTFLSNYSGPTPAPIIG